MLPALGELPENLMLLNAAIGNHCLICTTVANYISFGSFIINKFACIFTV